MNRRALLSRTLAGVAIAGAGMTGLRGLTAQAQATTNPSLKEVRGQQHLDNEMVFQFVGAGHGNLARVKEMLAQESEEQKRFGGLVLAERELILGDLETALGGASHMGNREIALYLLDHGARIDAFAAAMLGYREVVLPLLKAVPQTATTKGPHGYTLLYHAAISGDIGIVEAIKPLLPAGAKDFNQALTAAGRAGNLEMTRWLVNNGVTDVNFKDGIGTTALAYATKNNFSDVAEELRQRGAQ